MALGFGGTLVVRPVRLAARARVLAPLHLMLLGVTRFPLLAGVTTFRFESCFLAIALHAVLHRTDSGGAAALPPHLPRLKRIGVGPPR